MTTSLSRSPSPSLPVWTIPVSESTAFTKYDDASLREDDLPSRKSSARFHHLLGDSISETYRKCNPSFSYHQTFHSRVLTQPSIPQSENPFDNEDGNLICRVHDKLLSLDNGQTTDDVGISFTILDLLGTGTFGQVFRCRREIRDSTGARATPLKDIVAVKIIKNKTAYYNQGLLEVEVVRLLNKNDENSQCNIVKILHSFEHRGHLCLVFELLGSSLLDVLTQNQYRGINLNVIQRIAGQILKSLMALQEANIIHCDLKPENILMIASSSQQQQDQRKIDMLKRKSGSQIQCTSNRIRDVFQDGQNDEKDLKSNENSTSTPDASDAPASDADIQQQTSSASSNNCRISTAVKVIDFGSACFEGKTPFAYIQSRFYRAPEILLGVPYNGAIDMWSFACVCMEMYLGLPLFPGVSQHNQLTRIVEMFGQPPDSLIAEGKNASKYFYKVKSGISDIAQQVSLFRLKTAEEYSRDTNTEIPILKKYLRYTQLADVIMKCPLPNKSRMSPEQRQEEFVRRQSFLDFVKGLLVLDPFERWTAKQTAAHPFVTGAPFISEYSPSPDPCVADRRKAFLSQFKLSNQILRSHHGLNLSLNIPTSRPRNGDDLNNAIGALPIPQHQPPPLSITGDFYSQHGPFSSRGHSNGSIVSNLGDEKPVLKRGEPILTWRQLKEEDLKSTSRNVRSVNAFSIPINHSGSAWMSNPSASIDGVSSHFRSNYSPLSHTRPTDAFNQQHNYLNPNSHFIHQSSQKSESHKLTSSSAGVKISGSYDPRLSHKHPNSSSHGDPLSNRTMTASYAASNYHVFSSHNNSLSSSSKIFNAGTDASAGTSNAIAVGRPGGPGTGTGTLFGSSVGSSYLGGGSMQDGSTMLTDFGQALLRPELDEQRHMQSFNLVDISSQGRSAEGDDNGSGRAAAISSGGQPWQMPATGNVKSPDTHSRLANTDRERQHYIGIPSEYAAASGNLNTNSSMAVGYSGVIFSRSPSTHSTSNQSSSLLRETHYSPKNGSVNSSASIYPPGSEWMMSRYSQSQPYEGPPSTGTSSGSEIPSGWSIPQLYTSRDQNMFEIPAARLSLSPIKRSLSLDQVTNAGDTSHPARSNTGISVNDSSPRDGSTDDVEMNDDLNNTAVAGYKPDAIANWDPFFNDFEADLSSDLERELSNSRLSSCDKSVDITEFL